MDFIKGIIEYIQLNWVEIGVAAWLLEQAMRTISKLTPWHWDNNLVDVIANALSKLFPKKLS